jgi:ATP-dependent Clp protease ATP-binding subunit ClpC
LGLVRESEGVAAQVLQKMGVSLQKVRQEIEAEVQPGNEMPSPEPKLTPKAKRVLELAADEARRMRHNYIGTEHLLLALLREKDGIAAQVLRKLGLNLEKARSQVMEYLGPEYDPAALAYRLKFIRDGRVVFVDVDARSGQILRQSR